MKLWLIAQCLNSFKQNFFLKYLYKKKLNNILKVQNETLRILYKSSSTTFFQIQTPT